MSPNLEQQDSTHSSENSSEGTIVPSHTDIPRDRYTQRPVSSAGHRISSRPKSSASHKLPPQDGEALVVTDLEDEGTDSLTAGGGPHNWDNQGEESHKDYVWSHHDAPTTRISRNGRQLSDNATSPHSLDGDGEPEPWWSEGGPVATVKLVLEAGVGVITRAWPLHQAVHTLKLHLSRTTQVPPQFLELSVRGRVLSNAATLSSVGVEANETVQVSVSSKRPHSHPLTLLAPTTPTLPTPDVITVIVSEGGGREREVVVEVEWGSGHKPWLGGYRHKLSGLHYHNASTQTLLPPRTTPGQVSRGTQTVQAFGRGSQTRRCAHTQTTQLHPLLYTPTPVIITPGPYSPVRRYDIAKVLIIQQIVRGWLARKHLRRLRQAKEAQSLALVVSDASSITSQESDSTVSSLQHKASRQPVPMTELYSRLENWRRKQVSQVNATLTGQQRRKALVALLDKETELLRSLESHRALRSARRRNAAVAKFLHEVSQAQIWQVGGAAGGGVEVETPDTQPIRTLAALATALQQDATAEDRAKQLNTLSSTVEHYYPSHGNGAATLRTAADLSNLARRGLNLLSRGTCDNRMRGLRKRLHTLIITYLHQVQGRVTSIVAPRSLRAAGAKPVLVPTRMT